MVNDFFPGPAHPPKVTGSGNKVVSIKADLSRPAHPLKTTGEQFSNSFTCDALACNGNELHDPPSKQGKAYTDTDSDDKTEIITDITCKFKGRLIAMEFKVDPGSETNCILLSHFRCLFPQLCSNDNNPKENALEPTLAQFEAYDGGILHSHGWIILPTWDIRGNKFHPMRYYVVTREEVRILISHAMATWLGLVKVLCPNKAPKIKRQVASVSKKAKEPLNQNNNNFFSGPQHPPKVKYTILTPQPSPRMKYSYNNKQNISFQDQNEQHPPKVKYFWETVPKLVIKHIGDTAYDSYISETLYPLKSVIKPKKQMRFAGDPVTSVKTIPVRRTRPHPPKRTINAGDPDLLIPIELSQSRADMNLYQYLRGNLSVMSPRESHHTEEKLPTVPLGQFQTQWSDNTTTNSIAHSNIQTPSQSKIKSDHNNSSTITKNIVPPKINTYSQREIFSEIGTGTSSSKDCLTVMETY